MGAPEIEPKLRDEQQFEIGDRDFSYLTHREQLFWLAQARKYHALGQINHELIYSIVHSCHWFAESERRKYFDLAKSLIHRFVAVGLLILSSPLFLLVGILIKLDSPGKVFYSQIRMGRYGCPFRIYKFRTMDTDAERKIIFIKNKNDNAMFKNRNDTRMTRVGRVLRKVSLDELPQLINVVLGDMDLIGPRPLVPEDTACTPEEDYLRFSIRPGMTGLWQATIRDSADGRLKIKMDAEYVANRGWMLDFKILLKTFPALFKGS